MRWLVILTRIVSVFLAHDYLPWLRIILKRVCGHFLTNSVEFSSGILARIPYLQFQDILRLHNQEIFDWYKG